MKNAETALEIGVWVNNRIDETNRQGSGRDSGERGHSVTTQEIHPAARGGSDNQVVAGGDSPRHSGSQPPKSTTSLAAGRAREPFTAAVAKSTRSQVRADSGALRALAGRCESCCSPERVFDSPALWRTRFA
jgi:hypothetical protein